MRKIYRFITSRLFWNCLILLIELTLLFGLIYSFSNYNLMISTIFYVVFEILAIILMLYIVSTKGNVAYKLTWLFFIGVIPMLGVIAYLMFGNKKFTKRQQKKIKPIMEALQNASYDTKAIQYIDKISPDVARMAQYIFHASGTPLFGDTKTTYFPLGDNAWPVMLDKINSAKHYIFLEYFILAEGKMLDSIINLLIKKAKAGIDVRIMYDDFGSISTLPSNYPKYLKRKGIKCVSYNRFKPFLDIKMNNRDHRKLLIIDGHTGFTGGINIADEYVNLKTRFGHWKDNAIMLQGEAVWGMTTMFLSMWDFCYNTVENFNDFHYIKYASELGFVPRSNGFVQPYTDYPFDYEAISETIYIHILMRAKKYVYITTPYLILSPELENAIKTSAKQGINVIILTPGIPDKKTVFSVTRSYYKNLLEAGVKIYEYTPGFVHSKMFICDDNTGTVGTANLDYRSLFLHLECGVFLYNDQSILQMKKDFESSIKQSKQWTLNDFKHTNIFKRMWWAILRIFAPLM